jgi:hypothetical protein
MRALVRAIPGPPDKPREEWNHSELLLESARLGGLRLIDVLATKLPKLEDNLDDPNIFKWARLQTDAGAAALKLLASVQETSMRQQSDDKWSEILQRVNEEQERIKRLQEDRRKAKQAQTTE